MFVLAVLFVAFAIGRLLRVEGVEDGQRAIWHQIIDKIVEAVPLTAVKVVLVSWQIITQVKWEYASFQKDLPLE